MRQQKLKKKQDEGRTAADDICAMAVDQLRSKSTEELVGTMMAKGLLVSSVVCVCIGAWFCIICVLLPS